MIILIGLVLNKICLKRSFSKFKSLFCFTNPQLQSFPIAANQLATISSDVQEALPQPPLTYEGDIEIFVTPATHLVTFFFFLLFATK